MKGLVGYGKNDIRCEDVPDAQVEHPFDVIIKLISCALWGRSPRVQRVRPCHKASPRGW
jgi:hypothetical protein